MTLDASVEIGCMNVFVCYARRKGSANDDLAMNNCRWYKGWMWWDGIDDETAVDAKGKVTETH